MKRQKSFKVIIEDIIDTDPMGAIKIPTRDIQIGLIDLGLGKIKALGGMYPHARYSNGNPRKYFMSIVVHFENTIDNELRDSIEEGNNIILNYKKDNSLHNNSEIQELSAVIKKYI